MDTIMKILQLILNLVGKNTKAVEINSKKIKEIEEKFSAKTIEKKKKKIGIPVEGILKVAPKASQEIIEALQDGELLEKYGLKTSIQKRHFISQMAHESGLIPRAEKGYSIKRARQVGRKKCLGNTPTKLWGIHKPGNGCLIFNCAYGGRMENDTKDDGCLFRGRGLIQLTGKRNYRLFTEYRNKFSNDNLDFTKNPDLILEPKFALESALGYGETNGLNELAKEKNVRAVELITKRINGGRNGLADRIGKFNNLA